jgi:hypothetical protein
VPLGIVEGLVITRAFDDIVLGFARVRPCPFFDLAGAQRLEVQRTDDRAVFDSTGEFAVFSVSEQ